MRFGAVVSGTGTITWADPRNARQPIIPRTDCTIQVNDTAAGVGDGGFDAAGGGPTATGADDADTAASDANERARELRQLLFQVRTLPRSELPRHHVLGYSARVRYQGA